MSPDPSNPANQISTLILFQSKQISYFLHIVLYMGKIIWQIEMKLNS